MSMHRFTTAFSSLWVLVCCIVCMCEGKQNDATTPAKKNALVPVKPLILRVIPHDSTAFTQGLFYQNGKIFESDGLYGSSKIRILDTNGITIKSNPVENEVFAEGCALFDGKIYQLTWKEQHCIIYTLDLTRIGIRRYRGEGWGLTSDSNHLIMSDGTDTLYFRDIGFNIYRKIPVTVNGKPLYKLNELEYVNGYVFANVWYSDYIFKIAANNGIVEKIIDCSELLSIENPASEQYVLNGIAYDSAKKVFYLTGKNWKKMFIVKIPD